MVLPFTRATSVTIAAAEKRVYTYIYTPIYTGTCIQIYVPVPYGLQKIGSCYAD